METAKEEWFCLIRTTEDHYQEVEQTIRTLHPYEEPGIVALPIVARSQSYLDWIWRETHPEASRKETRK
jgi:periplasmic divalent cation tolerance protein